MNSKYLTLFLLVLASVVLIFLGRHEAKDTGEKNVLKEKHFLKILNFKSFMKTFKRAYGHIEKLKRKAIYLINSVKIFLHNVSWMKGRSKYYLKVGPLADYTDDELQHIYASTDVAEMLPATLKPSNIKVFNKVAMSTDVAANTKLISKTQDGKEADERRVYTIPSDKLNDKLIIDSIAKCYKRQLLLLVSWSNTDSGDDLYTLRCLRYPSRYDKAAISNRNNEVELNNENKTIYYDWRNDNCLLPVQDQGEDCNSCWAFTAISMLEHAHCRQKGQLVKFSEQHYVDCGPTFELDRYRLDGCHGGPVINVHFLINHFGVELGEENPYKGSQGECKHPRGTPKELMGRLRPRILSGDLIFGDRALVSIDYFIDRGPVMASINVPSDFSLYGGGIHTGETCNKKAIVCHSMLVIGDGIEDGVEYWLFRNSHGAEWGHSGHFKLAKSAPAKCSVRVIHWNIEFPQDNEKTD